MQFVPGHVPFQAHLDDELVPITDSQSHRIYSKMIRVIGGWIHRINFQLEWRLCQSAVDLTRPNWPSIRAVGIPGRCITQLVIFDKMSAGHWQCSPQSSSGWSHVPRKMATTLTKYGIQWLKLCCLHLGTLTSLALAWNGIVQMDSSDIDTLCWLPGSEIIWTKSWWHLSYMPHSTCAQFIKACQLGIELFDHSNTQETSIFSQSCWRTLTSMLCTLSPSTQPTTSSSNTLSAKSITVGGRIHCIHCFWV